jgi:hypothetical protein
VILGEAGTEPGVLLPHKRRETMPTDRADADTQEKTQVENGEAEKGEVEAPEGTFPADAKGFDGTPVEQILKEREERLDPENRPENTEVSNAGREFNIEKGMFTDEPGFEEAEEQFTAEDP